MDDRREVIRVVADRSGRPSFIIEKDIWVVRVLDVLFRSPFGPHLVFKGGTSLSKAHKAIDRFSEDVDLTYDIREIIPELVTAAGGPLPKTPSQRQKWTSLVRKRLAVLLNETIAPLLIETFVPKEGCTITVQEDKIFIDYEPLFAHTTYVRPRVLLEFGGRSTGEPCNDTPIKCDAETQATEILFPTATVRAMKAERTFWEKATAIHVYCLQNSSPGERFARHWSDIACLDKVGFADSAIADRTLAQEVAAHKSVFFAEKTGGQMISYQDAIKGKLKLIPEGACRDALAKDYNDMELLFDSKPCSFDELMQLCRSLEERANKFG